MAKITLSSTGPEKASPAAIWAAMLAVYIVWGSTYLAIRFAVESMPPFLMAGIRFILAGTILFAWRRLAGDPLPHKIEIRSAAIVGLFLLLGGNGAVVWAEQTVPSGIAALMVSSSPLWMLLIEALLPGGNRPSLPAMMGVVVGFAGVVLLMWPEQSGGSLALNPWGGAALIFASLAWSFGSIISLHMRLPSSPFMGTAVEMLAGGTALLALSVLSGELAQFNLASVTVNSLLGLTYLILFGSLVGFSAYTWLLRVAPTSLVSTYAYVNPLVALGVGAMIGNEGLSPRALIAAAVIIGAVALITTARQPQKAQTAHAAGE